MQRKVLVVVYISREQGSRSAADIDIRALALECVLRLASISPHTLFATM